MCVVSAVGDNWKDGLPDRYPWILPSLPTLPIGPVTPTDKTTVFEPASKQEVEALRKEMEELKKLLIAAKQFDEATGQPNCELDEKVELIKRVAELVGVDMKDVFKNP